MGKCLFAAQTQHEYLMFPSCLTGFHQESVEEVHIRDARPYHSTRKAKLNVNTFNRAYILRAVNWTSQIILYALAATARCTRIRPTT